MENNVKQYDEHIKVTKEDFINKKEKSDAKKAKIFYLCFLIIYIYSILRAISYRSFSFYIQKLHDKY